MTSIVSYSLFLLAFVSFSKGFTWNYSYSGDITCDDKITIENELSQYDIHLYQIMLNGSCIMSFDSCFSNTDIDIRFYLWNGVTWEYISNPYCATLGPINVCGTCSVSNATYPENFSLPFINPDPTFYYYMDISYNPIIPPTLPGTYQINIGCRLLSINEAAAYMYRITDRIATNVIEAEIECEQRFGSTLASIITSKDLFYASYVLSQAKTNLDELTVWIGLYKDKMSHEQWSWINGASCNPYYAETSDCVDLNWSNVSSSILSANSIKGAMMTLEKEQPIFVENIATSSCRSKQAALCDASGHYSETGFGFLNFWYSEWSKTLAAGETRFTAWHRKANFVMHFHESFVNISRSDYTLLNIYSQSPKQSIHSIKQRDNRTIVYNRAIQYESSFYTYFKYIDINITKYDLIHFDLATLAMTSFTIPWDIAADIDLCLVSNGDYLYIIIPSSILIFNLSTQHLVKSVNILDQDITACVMDGSETFIYIFGRAQDIIYKYDTETSSKIIVDELNLCSTGIGSAVSAANNKAYLHGCYIVPDQTLIFDMNIEEFVLVADIMTPTMKDVPYYRGARIALGLEKNVLMMEFQSEPHSWNELVLSTDLVAINFIDTTIALPIWVSDGIVLRYTMLEVMIEDYEWNITFYCGDTENPIHQVVIVNKTRDNCTFADRFFTEWSFGLYYDDCVQYFPLDRYVTLNDNDIDKLIFEISTNQTHDWATGPVTPLITSTNITVTLQKCIITVTDINGRSNSDNPQINLSYTLEDECYSRVNKKFLFNWTTTANSAVSSQIIMEKQVIIAVINESTHLCSVCNINDGDDEQCINCNNKHIAMQHSVLSASQTLSIQIVSNDIDLVMNVPNALGLEYFKNPDPKSQLTDIQIAFIVIGASVLVCVGIFICCWQQRKSRKMKQEFETKLAIATENTHYLKNPMVLFIGTAFYDDIVSKTNIDGFLNDLRGIDADYYNMKKLCRLLNWDIYPKQENYEWKQDAIIKFITDHAKQAADNMDTLNNDVKNQNKMIDGYDGMLIVFSGHGLQNSICSSDYQLIKKTAIHRLISRNHPNLREFPRIFIFDCCDGGEERMRYDSDDESDDKDDSGDGDTEKRIDAQIVPVDSGKNYVKINNDMVDSWKIDQKNPDYKLCIVHGSNEGFQAKIDAFKGSYLIHDFVRMMMDNVITEKGLFFGDIIDEIQEDLHNRGKQQITQIFNNNTRYLKFVKNGKILNSDFEEAQKNEAGKYESVDDEQNDIKEDVPVETHIELQDCTLRLKKF